VTHTIRTLRLGEIYLPGAHEGGDWTPVCAWCLHDGASWTLVDTGMAEAAVIRSKWRVEARGGGIPALQAGLADLGITPADITTVILTHLHFDHAWNLELFPAARVLVQKDELIHAIDPAPSQRLYYSRHTIGQVLDRRRPDALELIEGDRDLADGLWILKAPGHTPGMQAVCVRTARGVVGLVSDLGEEYGCWYPNDPMATRHPKRYLADTCRPGSIRSESERDYIASMRRILDRVDIVVPAHDARIPTHMPAEWWAVPQVALTASGEKGAG
jgi:glyoxylase-like metal-dependent hydrolase (beta-lactamase superfamily II)